MCLGTTNVTEGVDANRGTKGLYAAQRLGRCAVLVHTGLGLLAGLTLGCMGADPANESLSGKLNAGSNRPPTIRSVTLQPNPLVRTGPITALVDASDPNQNPLTFRYKWLVNDQVVPGQSSEQLPVEFLKRGDRVSVEVVPSDGMAEGAMFRAQPVQVVNTPPTMMLVGFEPSSIHAGLVVKAKAEYREPDGDPVSLRYRWWKNGRLVTEGEAEEFDTAGMVLEDKLQVEVLPSDGVSKGTSMISEPVAIENGAPQIASLAESSLEKGMFSYQVIAKDPEGDAMTFLLEAAPSGMTIDPQSGLIRWTPAGDVNGRYHVRVVVKDLRGSFAMQEFDLTVKTQPNHSS